MPPDPPVAVLELVLDPPVAVFELLLELSTAILPVVTFTIMVGGVLEIGLITG